MVPKAFIYCRISDDKTGARLGVQRQEEDCRAEAQSKGFEVVRVFTDNDISAYSGKARPGYKSMLKRFAEGDVQAVFCWHPDRLHRHPSELEAYIDASRAAGVKTHTVKAGEMDLSTDGGQLVARMLGAAARYESDTKATRIRRASEQLIRAGKWTGGTRPFGWKVVNGEPSLHPIEAPALADAFSRVIAGASLGSIIRDLNESEITTTRGKPWGYAQLKQALLRPRNAGLSDWHGEIVGKSTFPEIVSENIWLAAASILKDPDRRRSQSNKAVHLLAGIAPCHCGSFVRSATVTTRNGTKRHIYRCKERGLGHVSKRMEYVDSIFETVIVAVRGARERNEGQGEDHHFERKALQTELDALRLRRDDAALQAADGLIPMSTLGIVLQRIETQQADVEAKMVDLETSAAREHPKDIRPISPDSPLFEEWRALHIDDRRDYARSVCNVVLLPHGSTSTKVFNPDTVQVVVKASGEGPGPLNTEGIAKQRQAVEAAGDAPTGTFISLSDDGEQITYRLSERWFAEAQGLGDEQDDRFLEFLIPVDDRGERLLRRVRAAI